MIKKFYILLLAIVASVGMMNAKVTWNSSNIDDLKVRSYQSYSKEGVTLSANADMVEARWQDFGDESMDGISFNANETGGYTFSNTLGKNFTKIEMLANRGGGWDMANLGSGWSFYWDYSDNPATITWTGNASTVDLLKDASGFNGESVKSIVFYFVGDSEAPATYAVALKAGTANADKVKLSATSAVEGATVTVTPNEKYEIKAFKATYNTTEEAASTLDPGTGAYSFTMPAYDVTIEATIALKPVYTVALQDGTVNADKVTLSATSAVEGATVTVTPDDECEITAFKATYNTTEELSTSFNAETGAYSFTMPAYDVTIEATIALKPVPEGDIYAGFTATAGSGGFDNEGHANLVDNKFISSDWTKWCTNDGHKSVPTGESESCWWIDFEASAALSPTGYILTTGNDSGSEQGRNPKNWLLKAKLNADDAWTTIATVTNDATMKNKSFKDYKFFVDQSGTYQYFRFEVFANQGANVMQLCELRLIGTEPSDPLADCELSWMNVPEGGVVGTIGHEDEIELPYFTASLDFLLALDAGTVTLRLGSTDESVLAVYGLNNFAVNGVGECDVYIVHDEDAVFAYDSAAFHVTVNPEPTGNLKLIEFQVPASWENDNSPITSADFPDFVATTYEIASALPVTSEPSLVVFDFPGDDEVSVYTKMGGKVSDPSTGAIKREVFFENTQVHYYYPVLDDPEPEPTPTVWTALAVGDVIKVGDKIEVPAEGDGSWGLNGNVLRNAWGPYTLIRANIVLDDLDDPVVTEAEDGAYYVFKAENDDFYPLSNLGKGTGLVVTETSDGLVVTNVGDLGMPVFTVAVHENGSTPTAVENVQTNQVQGTKILRDGMLLIVRDGKTYNVLGTMIQ